MVDVAAEAGADAIKFQTFRAEALVSRNAPKGKYQKRTTGEDESQLEMIRKYQLDKSAHRELFGHCKKRGIVFLSSPFDLSSIDFLSHLGLDILKIPSGEIDNLPYLRTIGMLDRHLVLSTGMSDLGEIEDALNVLTSSGTQKEKIAVLHCCSSYPTSFSSVNLRAMETIGRAFQVAVGYSDHTLGIEIPVAAVAMGARIIEKHFTLDRNLPGPDHEASLDPMQLKAMVRAVRNTEEALGSPVKTPDDEERINKPIFRKSIVAAKEIKKGEKFTKDNITVKRPGYGMSPMRWDEIVGKKADRDYLPDELITQ